MAKMRYILYLTLASSLYDLFVQVPTVSGSSQAEAVAPEHDDNSGIDEFNLEKSYHVYAEEFDEDYEVKRVDKNLEARIANLLYIINIGRIIERNHHVFNYAHNPSMNREYESYMSGPEVDQKLCKKHLVGMNALLDELEQIVRYQRHHSANGDQSNSSALVLRRRHIRLARALDSFGRYESGLIYGRVELIGSYEQCLDTRLDLESDSDRQLVGMRYCKASLGFSDDQHPSVRNISNVYIQVAVCLPNSCHSNSLRDNKQLIQRLVDSQFSMPESMYVSKHRQIVDLFCLNDNHTSIGLPLSGKLFVIAAVIWTILLFVGTYHGESLQSSPSRILRLIGMCFNVRQLVMEFVEYGPSKKKVAVNRSRINLDAINFVKIIGMMSVVMGHSVMTGFNASPDGIILPSLMRKNPFMTMLIFTQLMVDTFFVMSGLLFSYIILKKYRTLVDTSRTFMQIMKLSFALSFARYIRIVPLYFIMYWFKRSVFIYSGSGPLWDPGFNKKTVFGSCKEESWLTPFTPLAAYMSAERQCLVPGWSLGCEIFFILLTTPVMILLIKKPRLGMLISLSLGLLSWAMTYAAFYRIDQIDLDSFNFFKSNFIHLIFAKHSNLYTNAHLRLAPVFGGLLSGYLLYCYEKNLIKSWPNWFAYYATRMAIASFILNLLAFAMIPVVLRYGLLDLEIIKNPFIHVAVTTRIVWSVASCIVLMRLVSDCKDGFKVKLLSGKSTRIMAKLSLAALLVNADILYVKNALGRNHIANYRSLRSFDNAVSGYVYTVVLAAFIHVLVESPINKMFQSAMKRGQEVHIKKQS